MASRIETLGTGAPSSRNAWLALIAIVLIAGMLALGAFVGSNRGTPVQARSTTEEAAVVVRDEPAPGLIKGGLQPRPFSPIEVEKPSAGGKAPDGFVRMPTGEFRPVFGS